MKVVIDISLLHPAALKRGVGFYSLNLFQALKNLGDKNQYFLKKGKDISFSPDLVHYPFFDPFFLTLPCLIRKKAIVTIHDLTPLKFPQHYPSGVKGKIKWQMQKRLVKNAKAIITDSHNSKKDTVEIIGYPQERIFPIYLAADDNFQPLKMKQLMIKRLREKYHLPEKFLFYVGDLNWNKNIKGLIRAFGEVGNKDKDLSLVLAGPAFENQDLRELKELKDLIEILGLVKRVLILGFIPAKDLVIIYNLAKLYIQPSFYEGFGLPVLEAMSCGCPVLSSNQGSLPEIGGQAVAYFYPFKENDLENNLSSLLKNKNKLKDLKKRGLMQAKKFSWRKTALETREVYEKIICHH